MLKSFNILGSIQIKLHDTFLDGSFGRLQIGRLRKVFDEEEWPCMDDIDFVAGGGDSL